jgi:predicted nucleic acid-binding protein
VLIDSNVLVDLLRNADPAKRYIASIPKKPFASVVTVSELLAGARSRQEEARIEALKSWMRFLVVDELIAERAGQYIKHYRRSHGLDAFDALIAATAEHHGLALATRNVKHFPMFPKLKAPY